MAVLRADIYASFPEFNLAPGGTNATQDALVDAKLVEAKGRVDYAVFQNSVNADSAVKYLTAHLLALSPSAVNLRLVKKDGSTIYKGLFDALIYANGWGACRVP